MAEEPKQHSATDPSHGNRSTKQPDRKSSSYFEQVLGEIRNSSSADSEQDTAGLSLQIAKQPSVTFDALLQQQKVRTHELNNDKKERENDLISKNQGLKKLTLILLFILLFAESVTLFVLTFFQGFKFKGFELDLWTLRIIVVASLAQISAMLTIAVRHLFPSKKT